MRGQKSALLGLALGLAVLGMTACEDKTTVDIPPPEPPPLSISVTPAAVSLQVGQSAQIVAQVTGGATGGDKSVTWASSNTSVASVSASGNVVTVNAVAAGVSTITATAVADANVKAAAAVTVTGGGGTVPPSISIKSITTGATNIPVNINNVFGQIEITLNLDVPQGTQVSKVELLANNTVIYTQSFSGAEAGVSFDEAQSAVDLIASWNTSDFTPDFAAGNVTGKHPNGQTTITAQVLGPQGTITANTSTNIVLNNRAFVYARITSPTGSNCTLSSAGLQWCTGDAVVDGLGVRFDNNANNALASMTLSAAGKSFTDATAPFTMTLQKASSPSGSSIAAVEATNVALTLNSLTAGGQVGPNCVVAEGTPSPLNLGCVTLGQTIPMANPLNHDNVAPSVTLFDLTPATLGCAPATACYISGNAATPPFAYSVRSGFFAHTDAGVGSPTATFMAGVPGSLIPVTTASDLAESQIPNYIASATSCDKLNNCRTVYAGPTAATPLTSATGAQLHGVDSTDPTATVGGLANNSINPAAASPAWTISFSDAGVGPSGFSANPVRVQVKQTNAAGVTCYTGVNPVPGTVACTTTSGAVNYQTDDGQIDIVFANQGYWGLDFYVLDQAKNFSKPNGSRLTLIDVTAPVMGGIAHPSSMAGGTAFSVTEVVTDNVDLERYVPWFSYGTGHSLEGPITTVGSYGLPLVSNITATYNVGFFVRALEGTTGTGAVVAGPGIMNLIGFRAWDVAGNTAQQLWGVSPAVLFPVGGTMPSLTTIAPTIFDPASVPIPGTHGLFVNKAPSPAQVCSGTPTACGSTPPASTVLSATMTGPNATFANPFTSVMFYYQDPASGRWVLIGTGSPSASDATVTSTRTWTYSFTWTVTGLKDSAGNPLVNAALPLVAVGVHSSGSAVISSGTPITIDITAT